MTEQATQLGQKSRLLKLCRFQDRTLQLYLAPMPDQHSTPSRAGSERRRSQRVLKDVPLIVRGETTDKRPFEEETFTIAVSVHGALLVLAAKVELGQRLVLLNPNTWDERECHVAFLGPPYAGLSQVGLEFTGPVADFWPAP